MTGWTGRVNRKDGTMSETMQDIITEALEFATEYGERPFAEWVEVTPNPWGGYDILNYHGGTTTRLVVDDNIIRLHALVGGEAQVRVGTISFEGAFAHGATVGQALKNEL